jgi:hypothetical protein
MSEIERRLIGQLTDPQQMLTVWELGLRSEHFEEPVCAAIFNFITEYWQTERMKLTPTAMVIATAFPGIQLPTDEVISPTWAAEELMQRYSRANLDAMMMRAAKESLLDPVGALKMLRADSHAAAESVIPRYSRMDMATSIEERRRRYYERMEGVSRGMTLGLPELDQFTNGVLPGELALLGAYSKTGKTMFLANAAIAARKAGYKPIFFSLEMPKEEIAERLDAMFSGLSYNRMTHSSLGIDEIQQLHQAQEDLASLGSIPIEVPEEGDRTVAALVNRARHTDADYLIIDQLSEMDPGRRTKDLKEHHSVLIRQLKREIGLGSAGRLPCFLAVQFNRSSQTRKEGIGLDSFANATEVEAVCDLALGLSRNAEMRINRQMRLDILGARRSDSASWLLRWDLTGQTRINVLNSITV